MICFEGSLSVKAVLLAKRRKVNEIWIDKKKRDRDTSFIIQAAKQRKVPVVFKSREEIDAVASGKTHGGIIAYGTERKMQTVEEMLEAENPFLAVLEGIEDPFNLGYALRTLYAAGCNGVLLNARDWSKVEGGIVKSSAGASEYINIAFVTDMASSLKKCQEAGCKLYCAMRKDAIEYYDANYQGPIVLAIGGEMRGLSKAVLDAKGENIYVPYANDFRNALNASSAVAAISFEIVRQRRK